LIFLGSTHLLLRLGWGSLGLAASRLLAYGTHTIFSVVYAAIFILGVRRGRSAVEAETISYGAQVAEPDVAR
jgi:hypothetical protein